MGKVKGEQPPLGHEDDAEIVQSIIRSAAGHVNGEGIRVSATELERLLIAAINAGRHGRVREPITAESLNKIDRPDVIVVGEGIVALVDANGTTIDMTTLQAIQLRLISGIPGHFARIDPMRYEEVWLGCSCGKFHHVIEGSLGDLEEVWRLWSGHLETILNAPKLADLPDGTYYDGTYEWEKNGKDWTPLRAPQGMPREPEIQNLKRVNVTKTYEDIR